MASKDYTIKRGTQGAADYVEITMRPWRGRVWHTFRLYRQNRDRYSVARPGRGGNFNLSFDWVLTDLPITGCGFAGIRNEINDRVHRGGLSFLWREEIMINNFARAINRARLMLKEGAE